MQVLADWDLDREGGRPVSQTAGPAGCSGETVGLTSASSSGRGLCFPLVKACVFGNEPKAADEVPLAPRTETAESTPSWQVLKLVFCASGLQVRRQASLLFPSWVQTARDVMKPNLPCPPQIVGFGMVCVPTGHSPILYFSTSFNTCTEMKFHCTHSWAPAVSYTVWERACLSDCGLFPLCPYSAQYAVSEFEFEESLAKLISPELLPPLLLF